MQRRKFSREYKLEAVKFVRSVRSHRHRSARQNLSMAVGSTIDKAPDGQMQFDPSSRTRQITDHRRGTAMNSTGNGPAVGTYGVR